MAELLPPALTTLIEALGNLPGVGPRTAERYAYFLVRRDPAKSRLNPSSYQRHYPAFMLESNTAQRPLRSYPVATTYRRSMRTPAVIKKQ
jgi:hypothetical protein